MRSGSIAVLEADVAHLKGGAVSKTVVDQVLSYLAGLDSNLAGSGKTQEIKGDIALLTESIGFKTSLPYGKTYKDGTSFGTCG